MDSKANVICSAESKGLLIQDDGYSVLLTSEDCATLVRAYFTNLPLEPDDPRLELLTEIREAVVKEEPDSHRRWIVLDALRVISLKKWRSRKHA